MEPENRLVARTLERQWEEALAGEAQLKADYRRFVAEQPATLSAAERDAIRRLASDPPFGVSPATRRPFGKPRRRRQRIVRRSSGNWSSA